MIKEIESESSDSDRDGFKTSKFEECFPEEYKIIIRHSPSKNPHSRVSKL
jgi:hypothetical protein